MAQRYIAVIADIVGSRGIPRSKRPVFQKQFAELIKHLNRDFRKYLTAGFAITLGDEFQGLLNSASPIPDLIWRLEQDSPQRQFRFGMGLGTLDTPLQKYAINIDGPALHNARAAIDCAKKTGVLGGVFSGFGEFDEIMNGMSDLLWFHRSGWTDSQRRIANLLRSGMSQTEVAKKLRIKRQVVSKQVSASGYAHYMSADRAWRMLLQKQIDPLLGSKHDLSQNH
jgi:SatD family (SatD)